ncbi:hypothetical protein EYR36_005024 [Pleurotus pulmonarius]|nr:hypothetical protein EYR36_005024 [Pleurotus pulmonarius]
MKSFIPLTLLFLVAGSFAKPLPAGKPKPVSSKVFSELQLYAKYSVVAYRDQQECIKPLNNTAVARYDNKSTQAILVRDDKRKEFVLAFRGTEPTKGDGDCSIDAQICKTPLAIPGVTGSDLQVHTGFQKAWKYVSPDVILSLKKELKSKPTFSLVVTGHSLGGAIAALASLEIKTAFPKLNLRLFSYGAPRVGNLSFAKKLQSIVGISNIFRGVNQQDPVSFMPPLLLGYRHFPNEYWQFKEPASYQNVVMCQYGEDKDETTDKDCNNTPVIVNPLNVKQHKTGVSFYLSATGNNRLLKPTNVYHELKWALYHISQRYDIPVDVGLTEEGLVDAYIRRQTPIAQDGILANIGPNGPKCGGAKPGTVIASPSTHDPDYLYTWTRDAALVVKLLVDQYTQNQDASLKRILDEYVAAQAALQKVRTPSGGILTGGLGEPKYNIDHTAFTEPWGRPQHDGPALRATTLLAYAKALLKQSDREVVQQSLWPVLEKDLAYVVKYWNRTGFDLWEEVSSSSFFTTAVQHRALREGAALARNLNKTNLAQIYSTQADNTLCFLQSYWNADIYYVVSNTGGGRSGKDANSILASIHTFDPSAGCDATTFQPCSDKALATLYACVDAFRGLYRINRGTAYSEAVAVGRYPEDIYMGGHPWYLTTAAVAEQLYDALYVWKTQGYIEITRVSLSFFRMVSPRIRPGTYTSDRLEYHELLTEVRKFADGFIAVNAKYTPWDGSLAEQFHRDNGQPLSARDLTWSYAASITAFNARAEVLTPGGWGAKGLVVPPVCEPNPPQLVSVTFSVHAETQPGEAIFVTGSSEALSHWSTDNAVKLSADKYPVWSGSLDVPAESALEYKYIRKANHGAVSWEQGGNRFLETSAKSIKVSDEWR